MDNDDGITCEMMPDLIRWEMDSIRMFSFREGMAAGLKIGAKNAGTLDAAKDYERRAAADKRHHEWRFGTPEGLASLAAQWKKARAERLATEAAPR